MSASDHSKLIMHKMYLAYYGRPADPQGLEYWAQRVDDAEGDLTEAMDAFSQSDENDLVNGGLGSQVLINNIYLKLFDRDADDGGLAFYEEQLESGNLSLVSIALDVLNGAQNSDHVMMQLKLEYAEAFTLQLKVQIKKIGTGQLVQLKLKLKNLGDDDALQDALDELEGEIEAYDDDDSTGDAVEMSNSFDIDSDSPRKFILTDDVEDIANVLSTDVKAQLHNVESDMDSIILPFALIEGVNEDDSAELTYNDESVYDALLEGADISTAGYEESEIKEWLNFLLADDKNKVEIEWEKADSENNSEDDDDATTDDATTDDDTTDDSDSDSTTVEFYNIELKLMYKGGFVKLHDLVLDAEIMADLGFNDTEEGEVTMHRDNQDESLFHIDTETEYEDSSVIQLIGFYAAEGLIDIAAS